MQEEEKQIEVQNSELFLPEDDPIPEGKVKFETRIKLHSNGSVEREIWISDQKFDWSVDITSFHEAVRMGSMYKKAVQQDIVKHFVNSVSDFLGRKVTMKEVNEATKRGWI
jgi:hypothetical protein